LGRSDVTATPSVVDKPVAEDSENAATISG
jgi:hypothetical protein